MADARSARIANQAVRREFRLKKGRLKDDLCKTSLRPVQLDTYKQVGQPHRLHGFARTVCFETPNFHAYPTGKELRSYVLIKKRTMRVLLV